MAWQVLTCHYHPFCFSVCCQWPRSSSQACAASINILKFLLPHPDSSLKHILCSHPPRDLFSTQIYCIFSMYSFSVYTAWFLRNNDTILAYEAHSSAGIIAVVLVFISMINIVKKVPWESPDRMIRECFVEGAWRMGSEFHLVGDVWVSVCMFMVWVSICRCWR